MSDLAKALRITEYGWLTGLLSEQRNYETNIDLFHSCGGSQSLLFPLYC